MDEEEVLTERCGAVEGKKWESNPDGIMDTDDQAGPSCFAVYFPEIGVPGVMGWGLKACVERSLCNCGA